MRRSLSRAGILLQRPEIGSNKYFSCSQACMVRYYAASEQKCLDVVNEQAKTRGCARKYKSRTFEFCLVCTDVTEFGKCADGVPNGVAAQVGYTFDVTKTKFIIPLSVSWESATTTQVTTTTTTTPTTTATTKATADFANKVSIGGESAGEPANTDEIFSGAVRGGLAMTACLIVFALL